MKQEKKNALWRGIAAGGAVLLGLSVGLTNIMFEYKGNINAALNINTDGTSGSGNLVYKSDYGELSDENLEKLIADEKEFAKTEMEEGAVLLKNNGVLPLSSEKKITLFGRASYDIVYMSHGGGSAAANQGNSISLKSALEEAGYEINPTLYEAYEKSTTVRVKGASEGVSDIGEEDISFYTSAITGSYSSYKEAAVVVFSRDSGEGQDFNFSDSEGISQLALHEDEKALLRHVKSSGFDKIVVLINSGNPMELGWLDESEYGVDACLWVGEPGRYGTRGIASLLKGEVSPSGKLVDTYATDSLSSPATANSGDFTFSGDVSDASTSKYVVYAEGIYSGYKYYETRYEDCVLDAAGVTDRGAASSKGVYASAGSSWSYSDEIVFPFGYGLSYTSFSQTLESFTYDSKSDSFIASVKVKNTGSVAGKSVVELYAQSPYTEYDIENKVEKSAVQIAGFTKTDTIEAGKEVTVSVTVPRYYIASYDSNNAKTYILDAGTYYFAIGEDSHDALNNILAKKAEDGRYSVSLTDENGKTVSGDADKSASYTLDSLDKTTYATSAVTGNAVTNQYTGDYATDINDYYDSDVVTYLTRNDWENTYPEAISLEINGKIKSAMVSRQYSYTSNEDLTEEQISGKDNSIKFYEMHGVAYDDAKWDDFLNQLSVADMSKVISDSLGQPVISSVGKPANKNADGPAGYGMSYRYGEQDSATCYVSQNLAASTWSTDVMSKFGSFYGEDCIYARGQMCWAPGMNLHRAPFGGRAFEYMSEDGLFTGIMAAAQAKSMVAKGVIVTPKHGFSNDQETNRSSLCAFMTEQTAREGGMKAFELIYTEGGATGIMTAMNRIGCKVSNLQTAFLRNIMQDEWGFTGIVVSDSAGKENEKIPTVDALIAGTNMFCLATRTSTIEEAITSNSDSYLYSVLREANHRYYYAYANSTLVNGLTESTEMWDVVGWWQYAMIALNVVCGLAAVGGTLMFVYGTYIKKKDEDKTDEEVSS